MVQDVTSGGALGLHAKARLALEVVRVTPRARRAVAGGDARAALAVLRDGVTADGAPFPPAKLAHAARRVVPLVPGDSRCLVQALVLSHLLARRGISSTLVIGVQPGADVLDAHAWVEVRGHALLPTQGFPRLVEL